MDIERLFDKLDIENPEEFKFYENLEALIEEEEHIESELITDVLKTADKELLLEHAETFFERFLNNIPEGEDELSIIVEIFKNNICGLIHEDMSDDAVNELAEEIYKFRKWYAIDHNAADESDGSELSIRDARYELLAAGFLGESKSYDFGRALVNGPDSYGVKVSDLAALGVD